MGIAPDLGQRSQDKGYNCPVTKNYLVNMKQLLEHVDPAFRRAESKDVAEILEEAWDVFILN